MTFEALEQENKSLKSVVSTLSSEVTHLKLVVKKLQHELFGKSSERRGEDDPKQGSLFALGEPPELELKETPIPAHSRRSQASLSEEEEAPEGTFPEHLRREEQLIDEKPAGIEDVDLELVSEKITERLTSTPEEHHVIRIVRRVYKQKSTGEFFTPQAPAHVLDQRCKVTAEFLVLMVIKKVLWHLPLFRQEQQLRLQGIKISRDRLVSWTIRLGELFQPIAKQVAHAIRGAPVVHCDETPIVVGKGRQNKKYTDGYLWPILAPEIGVAFFYCDTRGYCEVKRVLGDFAGTLVSDAWDVYEKFVRETGCRWQLCWMHIRRNFVEAETSNEELAKIALEFIRKLYDIEARIRNESSDRRALYRQRHSAPILVEFKQWMTNVAATPAVITDELMSKAISYVSKRWEAATLFLFDGNVPIDNGADERALRPTKLGAKNWLHCASEEGAHVLAVFYTLIGSALMHGIHPYYYLLDLTKRIDDPTLTADDLIPHRWKERFFEQAVPIHLRELAPRK